ncbi:MAG: hypothetical protein DMG67_07805 [Acidobacteria bacterium]|nr:MAG: hypothetical protein DMG67_07805 [Acidobacteriota bacterium]
MSQFLQQLTGNFTNNFVAIAMTLIALGLGLFSILYLNKRRQLLHKERMASLIKGLHYAGVAQEIFGKTKPKQPCNHLLCGLRWLLGAVGLASAVYGYIALQPGTTVNDAIRGALTGAIPAAIGLAHLIFNWLTGRAKLPVPNLPIGYRPGLYYRPAYRPNLISSRQNH